MTTTTCTIVPFQPIHRPQILSVWEKSVLATHDFLSGADFEAIKSLVATIDFTALEVYCLLHGESVIGFIGVADQKIEMLFLDPDFIGKGLGKKMMQFALEELKATKVDVNEQNEKAVRFYQQFGFVTYERTSTDDQGNPYPILRMQVTDH